MAKVRINGTQNAVHDAVQLEGLTVADFEIGTVEKKFGSDGEPDTFDIVGVTASGTVVFDNVTAYNQALAGAESNLVITTQVKGGVATRVLTFKNAVFTGASGNLPRIPDSAGGTFRCKVRLNPGASDTVSSIITEAAGA